MTDAKCDAPQHHPGRHTGAGAGSASFGAGGGGGGSIGAGWQTAAQNLTQHLSLQLRTRSSGHDSSHAWRETNGHAIPFTIASKSAPSQLALGGGAGGATYASGHFDAHSPAWAPIVAAVAFGRPAGMYFVDSHFFAPIRSM